jgi:uncharacterized membrane protein HdeD (DUF308 family)
VQPVRLQLVRPTRSELAGRWRWLRALGVAFLSVAAGVIACAVVVEPRDLVKPLAWSLLALAGTYGAAALVTTGERARGLQAGLAAAYTESGVILLIDPQVGPLVLLFAMSGALVLGGVVQVAAAAIKPHAQSRPEAAGGLVLVAIGAMVALQWPLSAIPALCAAFGLAAAGQGAAYLRLAAVGARLDEWPRSLTANGPHRLEPG